MGSMYRKYVEEQLPNRFVYESLYGFMTYNHTDNFLQLEEIYIEPANRRQGFATELYDKAVEIGKEKGCEFLKGSVIIGTNNAEGSLACLLRNKFNLYYTDGIMIYLKRDIEE